MATSSRRRTGRTLVGALGASALLATTLIGVPAAAADPGADLAKARAVQQPTLVKTSSSSKGQASSTRLAAADTAGSDPEAFCGAVSIAPGSSPAGYDPLSSHGVAPVAGVGDDTYSTFAVPAYRFASRTYTQLSVSSNGFILVGDGVSATFANQNLPDQTDPDGVLAPFWTDLNPATAGELRVGTLTDGSDTWIVVDWDGVAEFSLPSRVHSFEVWIGIDGDANPGQDISYAYGTNTGNGDGGLLTVGAENQDGTTGGAAYYNGTGTLPTAGTQLRVGYDGAPVASFVAAPTTGPAPLHVAFDATGSSDDDTISSYDWDFGDGTTGTGVTPGHDYAAGVHTAKLTVTDNDGKTCSVTQGIDVSGGFSVDDVSVNEAAGTATFTVSRTGGPAASVDVASAAGTATTPADFTGTPTSLSFADGETSQPYVVTIAQDQRDEFNEHYQVRLSNPVNGSLTDATGRGTIVDDDPLVRLSVSDAHVVEGNSGTRNLGFSVTMNRPSGKTVKVTLHTADGSATAPSDYVSKTVTLTFSPGQTTKSVPVAVKGDLRREPNETFSVLLNNPVNATLLDPRGTGGIVDND